VRGPSTRVRALLCVCSARQIDTRARMTDTHTHTHTVDEDQRQHHTHTHIYISIHTHIQIRISIRNHTYHIHIHDMTERRGWTQGCCGRRATYVGDSAPCIATGVLQRPTVATADTAHSRRGRWRLGTLGAGTGGCAWTGRLARTICRCLHIYTHAHTHYRYIRIDR